VRTHGSIRWILSSEHENRRKSLKVGPPSPGSTVLCAITTDTKRAAVTAEALSECMSLLLIVPNVDDGECKKELFAKRV
jgi:hypothetical protein